MSDTPNNYNELFNNGRISIRRNNNLNGFEFRFATRNDMNDELYKDLKSHGFRWSFKNATWYHTADKGSELFVDSFIMNNKAVSVSDNPPVIDITPPEADLQNSLWKENTLDIKTAAIESHNVSEEKIENNHSAAIGNIKWLDSGEVLYYSNEEDFINAISAEYEHRGINHFSYNVLVDNPVLKTKLDKLSYDQIGFGLGEEEYPKELQDRINKYLTPNNSLGSTTIVTDNESEEIILSKDELEKAKKVLPSNQYALTLELTSEELKKYRKEENIKEWYKKGYPYEVSVLPQINDSITFEDFEKSIYDGTNVNNPKFDFGDSIVRERVFNHISEINNAPYSVIYNAWINSEQIRQETVLNTLDDIQAEIENENYIMRFQYKKEIGTTSNIPSVTIYDAKEHKEVYFTGIYPSTGHHIGGLAERFDSHDIPNKVTELAKKYLNTASENKIDFEKYCFPEKSDEEIKKELDENYPINKKVSDLNIPSRFLNSEIKPDGNVYAFSSFGYEGALVNVEADVRNGIPAIDIVGLADSSVKEALERMRNAFSNSDLELPSKRLLLSLSPMDLKKDGESYDLAMAIATLKANNAINLPSNVLALGSLELSGKIYRIPAADAAVETALKNNVELVICNSETAKKIHTPCKILIADNLNEVVEKVQNIENYNSVPKTQIVNDDVTFSSTFESTSSSFEKFKGYSFAVKELATAIAGKHNLLFKCTKENNHLANSLLLNAYVLTPNLTTEENNSVKRIFSLAGIDKVPNETPFRMPHESASLEGICGGGPYCRPGEISLAHNGKLVLENAENFRTSVIQMLRVPLINKAVTLSRAGRSTVYPANFNLLASCAATQEAENKVLRPLSNSIQMKANFGLKDENDKVYTLEELREKISNAYRIQRERGIFNNDLSSENISQYCKLDEKTNSLLEEAVKEQFIEDKERENILKVSLTLANMDNRNEIELEDIKKSLNYCSYSVPRDIAFDFDATADKEKPSFSMDKEDEKITLSKDDLEKAKKVLPNNQYALTLELSSSSEEADFFKKTIKNVAKAVDNAPKIGETDGQKEHKLLFHYFSGSTDIFVTELNTNDDEYFGYTVLNGDTEMSEWGYGSLEELRSISSMEMDFHVEEGITVERMLYEKYPDDFPQYAKSNNTEQQKDEKEISYSIYQVKDGDKYRDSRFTEYSENTFNYENYNKVYDSTLKVNEGKEDTSILDSLFEKFNTAHPDDYKGRSLSVSDVVVLNVDGNITPYYVQGKGFETNENIQREFNIIRTNPDMELYIQSLPSGDYNLTKDYDSLEEAIESNFSEVGLDDIDNYDFDAFSESDYEDKKNELDILVKDGKISTEDAEDRINNLKKEQFDAAVETARDTFWETTVSELAEDEDKRNLLINFGYVNKDFFDYYDEYKENLKNQISDSTEQKQYDFFVKDSAEYEVDAEIETVKNLSSKDAVKKYAELQKKGQDCTIGINIPGDYVFDDADAKGISILCRQGDVDTFNIFGDSFIVNLSNNGGVDTVHAKTLIASYKELYQAAKDEGLNVERPDFVWEKEEDLGLARYEIDVRDSETWGGQFYGIDLKRNHEWSFLFDRNGKLVQASELGADSSPSNYDSNDEDYLLKTFPFYSSVRASIDELINEKVLIDKEIDSPSNTNIKDIENDTRDIIISLHPHQRKGSIIETTFQDAWKALEEYSHVQYAVYNNEKDYLNTFMYDGIEQEVIDSYTKPLRDAGIPEGYNNSIVEYGIGNSGENNSFAKEEDFNAYNFLDECYSDDMHHACLTIREEGESLTQFRKRAYEKQANQHNSMNYAEFNLDEKDFVSEENRIEQDSKKIVEVTEENLSDFIGVINSKYSSPVLTVEEASTLNNILNDRKEKIGISENESLYVKSSKGEFSKTSIDYLLNSALSNLDAAINDEQNQIDQINDDIATIKNESEDWEEPDWGDYNNGFSPEDLAEHESSLDNYKKDLKIIETLNKNLTIEEEKLGKFDKDNFRKVKEYLNKENIQKLISDGTTYGFAHEGKIYLNPDVINSNAAVHEYTHLWDKYIQNTNEELWNKGKEVFKNTSLWQEVKADPNYADIADDEDLVLSECHSRICGKIAQKVLERIAETDGEIAKDKVIDWDKETWEYLIDTYREEIPTLSKVEEFISMPMKDLMKGRNIHIKTKNPDVDIKEELHKYSLNDSDIQKTEDILKEISNELKDFTPHERNQRISEYLMNRDVKVWRKLLQSKLRYNDNKAIGEVLIPLYQQIEQTTQVEEKFIVTESVTFPCSFTFPEDVKTKEEQEKFSNKVYDKLLKKYDFGENNSDTSFVDSPNNTNYIGFNISFALPVPDDAQYPISNTNIWIDTIDNVLAYNYGANIIRDGSERGQKVFENKEAAERYLADNKLIHLAYKYGTEPLEVANSINKVNSDRSDYISLGKLYEYAENVFDKNQSNVFFNKLESSFNNLSDFNIIDSNIPEDYRVSSFIKAFTSDTDIGKLTDLKKVTDCIVNIVYNAKIKDMQKRISNSITNVFANDVTIIHDDSKAKEDIPYIQFGVPVERNSLLYNFLGGKDEKCSIMVEYDLQGFNCLGYELYGTYQNAEALSKINPIIFNTIRKQSENQIQEYLNLNTYGLNVREAYFLTPKPLGTFSKAEPEVFADFLNNNKTYKDEPDFTLAQTKAILSLIEDSDYKLYTDSKGNLYIYDNSEDFDGTGEFNSNKDIVQFTKYLADKAEESLENICDITSLKPLFDYYPMDKSEQVSIDTSNSVDKTNSIPNAEEYRKFIKDFSTRHNLNLSEPDMKENLNALDTIYSNLHDNTMSNVDSFKQRTDFIESMNKAGALESTTFTLNSFLDSENELDLTTGDISTSSDFLQDLYLNENSRKELNHYLLNNLYDDVEIPLRKERISIDQPFIKSEKTGNWKIGEATIELLDGSKYCVFVDGGLNQFRGTSESNHHAYIVDRNKENIFTDFDNPEDVMMYVANDFKPIENRIPFESNSINKEDILKSWEKTFTPKVHHNYYCKDDIYVLGNVSNNVYEALSDSNNFTKDEVPNYAFLQFDSSTAETKCIKYGFSPEPDPAPIKLSQSLLDKFIAAVEEYKNTPVQLFCDNLKSIVKCKLNPEEIEKLDAQHLQAIGTLAITSLDDKGKQAFYNWTKKINCNSEADVCKLIKDIITDKFEITIPKTINNSKHKNNSKDEQTIGM